MTKKKKQLIAIFVFAISMWFSYKYYDQSKHSATDAAWVQAHTVKESTLALETHAIGTLVARSVEISPEMAGHVDKILFEDGAEVKQGDTLIQLNNAIYKAQYESSKATLTLSQRNFDRINSLSK